MISGALPAIQEGKRLANTISNLMIEKEKKKSTLGFAPHPLQLRTGVTETQWKLVRSFELWNQTQSLSGAGSICLHRGLIVMQQVSVFQIISQLISSSATLHNQSAAPQN